MGVLARMHRTELGITGDGPDSGTTVIWGWLTLVSKEKATKVSEPGVKLTRPPRESQWVAARRPGGTPDDEGGAKCE